ncbi:hypothetical protein [Actinoplanes sp. NPDC026623]|uniref:CHASE3 domain-containing protein n=1 Tax=Actinoplanes sp. NPDC026623 TaxID=3155610 RepID=UPI0033C07892
MRRDRSVGFLLTRAFVVLVSLIVCSGLVETAMVLQQHKVVRELTTHVQPLRLANAGLRGVLADAQRGVRGYSLTGDAQMLSVFRAAMLDYTLVGRSLRSLAGGDEARAVDAQLTRADAWRSSARWWVTTTAGSTCGRPRAPAPPSRFTYRCPDLSFPPRRGLICRPCGQSRACTAPRW